MSSDNPLYAEIDRLRAAEHDRDAYKANSEQSADAIELWKVENTKLKSALAEARAALENLYYYATPMAMSDRGAAAYGEAGRLLGRLANTETAGKRWEATQKVVDEAKYLVKVIRGHDVGVSVDNDKEV